MAAVAIAAACGEAAGPGPSLPAPRQLTPADGSRFTHFPRFTTYRWTPVPGAKYYGFEEDCFHCCVVNRWCTDIGRQWLRLESVRDTMVGHNFVGAQPGRWRVWAVDSLGYPGAKSGWWMFEYHPPTP